MINTIVNVLVTILAIFMSSIAAYFSIIGATALFPGMFLPVILMAGSLEAGKVLTTVWLNLHWNTTQPFLKVFLPFVVVILMCMSAVGTFGALSKAHIEHTIKIDVGVGQEVKLIQQQTTDKKNEIVSLEKEISNIDNPVDKLVGLSKTARDARRAIVTLDNTKKDRKTLIKEKAKIQIQLSELEKKQLILENELNLREADIGPIKYLANIFYDNASKEELEKAVRWAIVILVLVFDPLAIMLLLGSSRYFSVNFITNQNRFIKKQKSKSKNKDIKKDYVEISKNDITNFE